VIIGGAGGLVLPIVVVFVQKLITDGLNHQIDQSRQQAAAIESIVGSTSKFPRVGDVTNWLDYGVHQAISLPCDAPSSLSRDLPTYVERAIDDEVRDLIQEGMRHGGFVLLEGRAGKGKTRCLCEAVRTLIPNWQIARPFDTEQLEGLVSTGANLKHTVLWLDDFQDFLDEPRITRRAIGRLLSDSDRPVVIVGTIWPDIAARYSITKVPHDDNERDAAMEDLRIGGKVLALAHRVVMPDYFQSPDLEAAICADPRLEKAFYATPDQHSLTETLAAAPGLIHAFKEPVDLFVGKLVRAAVLIRRCGHSNRIGADLIRLVVETELSDQDRATKSRSDWLLDVMVQAVRPVLGTDVPILTAVRGRGETVNRYSLSDIVLQYAAEATPEPNDDQWAHIAKYAPLNECLAIGNGAYRSGRSKAAELAYGRAAQIGNREAMHFLAHLREGQHDLTGAEAWFREACATGNNAAAMACLGRFLTYRRGQQSEARAWWDKAAQLGNPLGMHELAHVYEDSGDPHTADQWFARAIDAGDKNAVGCYAAALSHRKDWDTAIKWARRAASLGDIEGAALIGWILLAQGHEDEAESTWTQLAADGNWDAMQYLSELYAGELGNKYHQSPRPALAEQWMRQGANIGGVVQWRGLGCYLHNAGEDIEAETWLARAADLDDTEALIALSEIELSSGAVAKATQHLHRAAQLEDRVQVLSRIGCLLLKCGDHTTAAALFRRAAEVGDPHGMFHLGEDEYDTGDIVGGVALWEKSAQLGFPLACLRLGQHYTRVGDIARAKKNYESAAYLCPKPATEGVLRRSEKH